MGQVFGGQTWLIALDLAHGNREISEFEKFFASNSYLELRTSLASRVRHGSLAKKTVIGSYLGSEAALVGQVGHKAIQSFAVNKSVASRHGCALFLLVPVLPIAVTVVRLVTERVGMLLLVVSAFQGGKNELAFAECIRLEIRTSCRFRRNEFQIEVGIKLEHSIGRFDSKLSKQKKVTFLWNEYDE